MHSLLSQLANRPAATVTDADVAAALEIIRADERVTKAIAAGREPGDAGRQLVDFEMTGFAGIHTVGRVISAIAEADRKIAEAAAKKAKKAATAARKEAKVEKAALVAAVAQTIAADEQPVEIVSWLHFFTARQRELGRRIEERSHEGGEIYREWAAQKRDAEINSAAIKVARDVRRLAHVAGLYGTPAQIDWAADIRAEYIAQMSDEDRALFMTPIHARHWIDARGLPIEDFIRAYRSRFTHARAAA